MRVITPRNSEISRWEATNFMRQAMSVRQRQPLGGADMRQISSQNAARGQYSVSEPRLS
jgi:hypothetical protein